MTNVLDYAPPMNDTEWITRAEAAERLDVSLQTVDRYTATGRLRVRKNELTKRVRLSAQDVETLRRERESA